VSAENGGGWSLNLAAALKLSEEISGEMAVEGLIEKLLRTAIEHAGARRGLLIVPRGDELRIEAEAMAAGDHVTVLLGESVNSTSSLPESVLRSVVRTQQAVLLDDAAAPNAFSANPYIARQATRSILCLPLLNRNKLIALLYLDNDGLV
jgi:GAF domain-containing protein